MLTLDAINQMLAADGLPPVASYQSNSDPHTARAVSTLNRVSELIQTTGWSVNTDYRIELALDTSSQIPLADNALNVSARKYSTVRRVSVRKQGASKFLYNVFDKTFVFTQPLKVDIVYLLDFEDLTPELQAYIAARAARCFVDRTLAAATTDKFASREEQETFTALVDAEADAEAANCLDDSDFCSQIAGRNNTFFG